MQKHKIIKIIIATIAVMLVLFIGYMIGKKYGSYSPESYLPEGSSQEDYLQEQKITEEEYQEDIKNAPPGTFKEEVFSLCGRITQINQKELILDVIFYPASPIENPKIQKRTVKLTDATEIVKQVEKTLEERENYQEIDMEKASDLDLEMNIITPSEIFKEIPIDLSEIKPGCEVYVVADKNIKDESEFFAQKIILRSSLLGE